ncbi:hypothetical protein ALC57_12428, partial [Trachymyrmex cornetzi]
KVVLWGVSVTGRNSCQPMPSIAVSFLACTSTVRSDGGGSSETEYKRIMLGRAGAEMPACKRNQFAIRYDPGNSGLA